MIQVLGSSWALLLGIMLLMVGNGIQGTLLGIRGALEGFSTFEMSIVMSSYFAGFLFGSRMAPELIRKVGHIRVFAALGSFISAVLILYPTLTDPVAWSLLRLFIGFCFSGVYVTAESWLNNAADNQNRGKALSLYLIVQMIGIIVAQGLVVVGDPSGFILFVIPSVLVSIAFAPILLSVSPTPPFDTARRLTLRKLFEISPLGVIGILFVGAAYAVMFGMAGVYGTEAGLSKENLSYFVASFYLGGLLLQYPIGWLSDRIGRRVLIIAAATIGVVASLTAYLIPGYGTLLLSAFFIGGMMGPLYGLLLAHTNDYLEPEEMAAASAGMMFINGVGAIVGPLAAGWIMGPLGAGGFFLVLGVLLSVVIAYAVWRSTQRAAIPVDETAGYVSVMPQASPVAVELAQEIYVEAREDAQESVEETDAKV
ncbi:MFS transporter [Maritimibacter sp. DP1N21-5]|uniref:MFS transporter n=1 Tax=Maritimibacter sp. DP1N21-5 TaxID=2836867 RepID=UPI001C45932B|nr:MFS transporter [Maritimibacter sp. DP1N21-5]MBV7409519.1 MFS transporter [Maritimibacter sp. DP1N21-5]